MWDALGPLLQFSYWFSSYPEAFQGVMYYVVTGLAVGSFVVGVVLKLLKRLVKDVSTRKIVSRLGTLALTMGILVALSFFFTQTSTPLLGDRFWFLLWLLGALVWKGFILRYAVAVAPRERAERFKQAEYQKYLPKRTG